MSDKSIKHGPGAKQPTISSGFLLYFGLVGFAVAQTVYDLILGTPEFLVARQNTRLDLWGLVLVISLALPLVLALTGWLIGRLSTVLGWIWRGLATFVLCAFFFAQLLQGFLASSTMLFVGAVVLLGVATTGLLLFTRFRVMAAVLAVLALSFPVLFLLRAPSLTDAVGVPAPPVDAGAPVKLPSIVMVLADELPLATVLDSGGSIDSVHFPNLHALQQSSTWFRQATTVADGTLEAVSAILTGRLPQPEAVPATIASLPYNLFTLLPEEYAFNVTESLSRLCPQSRCPVSATPIGQRLGALLLDLTALYLHRIAPEAARHRLPNVTDNWSGFFAARQEFFPGGWVAFAEGQAQVNRPGLFRDFVEGIENTTQPRLDFIHVLYPHVPYVYLPDGRNYGNHWLRGLESERWDNAPWGVLSARQRHFLQVQHFDRLLGELLDRLHAAGQFDDSLIVLVADHGAAFRVNDTRRILSAQNAADLLRVPMMIKWPGQAGARLRDDPAMTVDILPTLMAATGLPEPEQGFDGIDLGAGHASPNRERLVLSFRNREYRTLSAAELDVGPLVEVNRRALELDSDPRAPWGIGPLQPYHGRALDVLCARRTAGIRMSPSARNALPQSPDSEYVAAYVSGTLAGDDLGEDAARFVLERNGLIQASGETWPLRGTHHYFAMIEPSVVEESGAEWRVWLVDDDVCRGPASAMSE